MYVNTVDTVEKPWFWAFQNFKWIENWLSIKEVMSQNVLAMSTLLIIEKPWFWAFQNFKWMENRLNIKEVMSQNALAMSSLLIQLKSPDSELSKTLNGLKISWISRKLWGKMYWQCQHCWYSWKALILSFPKLQMDWKSVEYQGSYEAKCTGNVNTVDTVEKPWFWAFQNFKQIENLLNIKEVMRQNVLAMSTLLIQLKSPDVWAFQNFKQMENRLNIKEVMSQNALAMSSLLIQLKSPDSELSNTVKWIENLLNIKEVMSQNVLAMLTLLIVEKPWFWAFQNFKWIENRLNINEVISQNVLAMSTLLIQRIKACNALNAMYVDTGDTNEKTHRLD